MLICENDDGLIIGHQCGFYLQQDLGQSVFNTMLNDIQTMSSANEIIKLLQNTTQRSYLLPHAIVYHYLPAVTLYNIIEQADKNNFTLRFTNVDYMNDTMDSKYGHNEFIITIRSFLDRINIDDPELFKELRTELYTGFSKLVIMNPCTRNKTTSSLFMIDGILCNAYVCSLSLDPESIPLWRNYGGGFAESYAIGINTKYPSKQTLLPSRKDMK